VEEHLLGIKQSMSERIKDTHVRESRVVFLTLT
jgi:hypothetical protein